MAKSISLILNWKSDFSPKTPPTVPTSPKTDDDEVGETQMETPEQKEGSAEDEKKPSNLLLEHVRIEVVRRR